MHIECIEEATNKLQSLLKKHWQNSFRDELVISEFKMWLSVQKEKEV